MLQSVCVQQAEQTAILQQQVIDLQAIADNHENIQSAHAIHVANELWILIRGDGEIERETLDKQIQNTLNFEGKIQITIARDVDG